MRITSSCKTSNRGKSYCNCHSNLKDALRLPSDYYVFAVNELSWVNIDRFYQPEMAATQDVKIKDPDTTPEKVFIVFNELNSVLPVAYGKYALYQQTDLPLEVDAMIFAYKVVDGQPMIYTQSLNGQQDYKMEFRPCKFRDIRNVLSKERA